MNRDPNLALLESVAEALGPLRERVVFLGGCATGLLLTDPAAPNVRATRDVDVVVEVASRTEYHRLEKELASRGFQPDDSEGAPICRWTLGGALLDVMPTEASLLGFGNRWYPEAVRTAQRRTLPNGLEIAVVAPACFLATKLEAFFGRGQGDFAASHDLEDLVSVVDGRAEIVEETRASTGPLRAYLGRELGKLLADERFAAALQGHLPSDAASQARLPLLLRRLTSLTESAKP